MRLTIVGGPRASRQIAFSNSALKKTSGKWATRGPADHAAKFTTTLVPWLLNVAISTAGFLAIADDILKSGTSSSCNTISRQDEVTAYLGPSSPYCRSLRFTQQPTSNG